MLCNPINQYTSQMIPFASHWDHIRDHDTFNSPKINCATSVAQSSDGMYTVTNKCEFLTVGDV
jgi:hypothetical protein